MSAPRHVALIGCGFTGTSAFFQLVDRHPVREITIYEKSGEFGPGYPYRLDECPDYLLNNTNDSLCLVPSNRRAFLNWLEQRPEFAHNVTEKGHLPRTAYGAFLKDVFAATRTVAAIKNIKVNLIAEEATGLAETADGHVVVRSGSGEVAVDAAILTTGRCPELDPFPHPPDGSRTRYYANHVRCERLDEIPLDATVHVLGASLSAYDIVNRLFSPATGCRFERSGDGLTFIPGSNRRKVVLCSRSGRLKHAQSRHPERPARRAFAAASMRKAARDGGLRLSDVAAAIRSDVALNDATIDWASVREPYADCRSAEEVNRRAGRHLEQTIAAASDPARRNILVDLFADAQVEVWDVFGERPLTVEEECAYRERYESAVLTCAAPCPVSTAEKLLALHRAGRLIVVTGVGDVTFDAARDHYRIVHAFGVTEATILVNAIGSLDRDVRSPGQPPLIHSMVEGGLLHPDSRDGRVLKGAAVDMTTFRAKGSRNVYVANMLLWGPGFFTSSAFLMATVVERLLAHLYAPGEPSGA